MTKTFFLFLISLLLFFLAIKAHAQKAHIQWLTFEQLEDSLSKKPKKVFIDFYTEWCTYCRKMDKVVFTNQEVVSMVDANYYAIRFDAETEAEVRFGGQSFVNDQIGKSRRPLHQIAQLLAVRDGQFVPPVLIILDEDFEVKDRYFEYLGSKKLIQALK